MLELLEGMLPARILVGACQGLHNSPISGNTMNTLNATLPHHHVDMGRRKEATPSQKKREMESAVCKVLKEANVSNAKQIGCGLCE